MWVSSSSLTMFHIFHILLEFVLFLSLKDFCSLDNCYSNLYHFLQLIDLCLINWESFAWVHFFCNVQFWCNSKSQYLPPLQQPRDICFSHHCGKNQVISDDVLVATNMLFNGLWIWGERCNERRKIIDFHHITVYWTTSYDEQLGFFIISLVL